MIVMQVFFVFHYLYLTHPSIKIQNEFFITATCISVQLCTERLVVTITSLNFLLWMCLILVLHAFSSSLVVV